MKATTKTATLSPRFPASASPRVGEQGVDGDVVRGRRRRVAVRGRFGRGLASARRSARRGGDATDAEEREREYLESLAPAKALDLEAMALVREELARSSEGIDGDPDALAVSFDPPPQNKRETTSRRGEWRSITRARSWSTRRRG